MLTLGQEDMHSTLRKIALSLAALLAIIGLVLVYGVKQPPIFKFNQGINRILSTQEAGLYPSAAKLLVKLNIAEDWSNPPNQSDSAKSYPIVSFASSAKNQYPYQTYNQYGTPRQLQGGLFIAPPQSRTLLVSSTQEVLSAVKNAEPGDIITLSPGEYDVKAHSISVKTAGHSDAPIYLRAEKFGTVTLQMNTHEGFHVSAPFWVFENLKIRGKCANHSYCEHAFHIVGNGHSFTLRNSELVDFNAPIKANMKSVDGDIYFPDRGLAEYNSFYNTEPRTTNNPVTLLNLNSADEWVVRGNFIADFSKNGSDHVSYGAFMKGNSSNGLFEGNLVMCEHRLTADEGIRVGLSFGGGGTAKKYCKEKNCSVEHRDGIMRNNIIMNCSRDVGIYLNRAQNSQIYHNLLYNNLGIDVRFETSTAQIDNNIISGRIQNRDSGRSHTSKNILARDCIGTTLDNCKLSRLYAAPQKIDFRLTTLDNAIWNLLEPIDGLRQDFCGQAIVGKVNPGPLQYSSGMACLGGSAP
ncbi:MAG: hypothetical protein ACI9A2_002070 [Halioglobus sp.]|jgi:hypothetical protein